MFKKEIRVQWFDVDYADVVYFGNYFRYFTIAEDEFWRTIGLAPTDIIKTYNVSFTRIEAKCRYLRPARYEDLIEVYIKPEMENDRFLTFQFQIFRKKGHVLLAEGTVHTACISMGGEFKLARMPEEVFNILSQMISKQEEIEP